MKKVTGSDLGLMLEKAHFISNNSDAHVFVDYSSHTMQIDVIYYPEGYYENKSNRAPVPPNDDINGTIYLHDSELFFAVYDELLSMIEKIKGLKNENQS